MTSINVLRNKAQRVIESHIDTKLLPIITVLQPGDPRPPKGDHKAQLFVITGGAEDVEDNQPDEE